MLRDVTKKTKFSLLIIGLIFTGVLGTLAFFDSDFTEAAADFTYNVNVSLGNDANPGDGICQTGGGPGECSLEAAVEESNVDGGTTEIRFDGYGIVDYSLFQNLEITQPVTIIGVGVGNLNLDMSDTYRIQIRAGGSGSSISYLELSDCFENECIDSTDAENVLLDNLLLEDGFVRPGHDNWTLSNSIFDLVSVGAVADGEIDYNNINIDNNIFDCDGNSFSEEGAIVDITNTDSTITNINIIDNTFNDCGTQMDVINISGSDIAITDNTFSEISEDLIDIALVGDNLEISDNEFSNNSSSVIEIQILEDTENVSINENTIDNYRDGIIISVASDVIVNNLQVNDNTILIEDYESYGIAIYNEDGGYYAFTNSLIDNNQITGGSENIIMAGIGDNTSSFSISNNILSGSQDNNGSISIAGTQNCEVTIDNNYIENAENEGIFIANSTGSFIITNNTITQGKKDGIMVLSTENTYPSDVVITGNIINSNADYGILIFGGTNYTIEENLFTNGEDSAIAILAGSDFEINNNSFTGNSGDLLLHSGNPSNINFTNNTIIESNGDSSSVTFYGGGSNNVVSNNSFNSIPGNVIITLMAEDFITFSDNTFDDCADTIATGFFVNPFSVTYDSETYDDGTGGDGSLWFYSGDDLYEIGSTINATPVTDGINNFHLALASVPISGLSNELVGTFLFRDDAVSNENEAITTLASKFEVGVGEINIDYWQDDIWEANGTTSDYIWNEIGDDISISTAPDLYFANDEYLNFVYSLVTDDNIISNEIITNSGQGFKFHGNNNYVIDSSIDTANSSLVSSDNVTNYLDNTSFDSYDVLYGTIKVNYDARIHLVDDEGNNLENAIVSASYNPSYDLGFTDNDGLTSYGSLDAATITHSGMTENQYTITATHNEETKSIINKISEVDQEIDFNFTTASAIADISGYVKQGEIGLESIELHLYDTDDNLLNIIQTNSEGYYSFSRLETGVYEVVLQPISLPDMTDYVLQEVNPHLVALSGVNVEVNFNYSSSLVVNENINGNSNTPYVNYNYNINTNLNTNNNTNFQVNTNSSNSSNTNSNINLNLDSLVVNNVNLSDGEKAPVIEQNLGEDLFLEGKTTPNTRVVITIVTEDGEEIQIETMSDSEGNWEIIFDKDKLPAGDHTIYIQTELNGQLSEMVELAKLVISGDKKISTTWLVVVTISVLFIIIIIILILLYVKKRNKKDQA